MERYTEAQKKFIALRDKGKLSEEEQRQVRVLLLPRGNFLPETEEECFSLAKEYLGEELYIVFHDFLQEVARAYDYSAEWSRGDRDASLYCRLKRGTKTLCALGILLDHFDIVFYLGKSECERFERERDLFPRGGVQWSYDIAPVTHIGKAVRLDGSDLSLRPFVFRLMSYKKSPDRSL